MMDISIIAVPYDSAHRGVRMGAGPEHLLRAGLPERLAGCGNAIDVVTVEHRSEPPAEIRTAFELLESVARHVRAAIAARRLPLVLAGNCNASVGAVAALVDTGAEPGIIWLDAHGDFLTPEETTSGFLDGMALALLAGRCWRPLAASVPGHRPVRGKNIVLIGARQFDPPERPALHAAGVRVVPTADVRSGSLDGALAALGARVGEVHLHIDLDVLDSAYGRANSYAAPGGLSPLEVREAIEVAARRFRIRALTLASYDPACDVTGAVCEAALGFAEAVVRSATRASQSLRGSVP